MFCYWWKIALVGIYCQKWYVHDSEDNYGLAQNCQLLMESYVQMVKRELRVKGNAGRGWLKRVWNFTDLYCVGTMAHDEVNFYQSLQRTRRSAKLIYDEYSTRLLEEKLEYEMPDTFWELLLIVDQLDVGDQIPARIANIMNGVSDRDRHVMEEIGENNRRYANFHNADDIHDDAGDPNLEYAYVPADEQRHRGERRHVRVEEMRRQRRLLRDNRARNPLAAGISQ